MLNLPKKTILSENTNVEQTLYWIKKMSVLGSQDLKIIELSKKFKINENVLKDVFDKVYDLAYYMPDINGKQQIKTVSRILNDNQANCVNYSILIGSILLNLKIDFYFKIVGFNTEFEHIYIIAINPVTKEKQVLDCVLGQNQQGKASFINRPLNGQFNKECKYKFDKLYKLASLEILNGIQENSNNKLNFIINRSCITRKGKNEAALYNGLTDVLQQAKTIINPLPVKGLKEVLTVAKNNAYSNIPVYTNNGTTVNLIDKANQYATNKDKSNLPVLVENKKNEVDYSKYLLWGGLLAMKILI